MGKKKMKGVPHVNRIGKSYKTLTVLAAVPGADFSYRCRCHYCDGEWVLSSRRVAEYIAHGLGCGCRRSGPKVNALIDRLRAEITRLKALDTSSEEKP